MCPSSDRWMSALVNHCSFPDGTYPPSLSEFVIFLVPGTELKNEFTTAR